MGKKPELSKELKRSTGKAQERYIKAYTKALKKHDDVKKAHTKAQKKLEEKYELVGKAYQKISDNKPQQADHKENQKKNKGKGKGQAPAGARPQPDKVTQKKTKKDAQKADRPSVKAKKKDQDAAARPGKTKKGADKAQAEKKASLKKADKKKSKKSDPKKAQKAEPKKTDKKAKKSAAQREAELILATVDAPAEEPITYEDILDAEAVTPEDIDAFEENSTLPELDLPETITGVGASEGLAPEEADEPDNAEETYEEVFTNPNLADDPTAPASAPEEKLAVESLLVDEADPLDGMTRNQLYKLAQGLEIPGRSAMTKAQLLTAVRAAR
ncbi:hypothetical protein [Rothia nasimurium]|uniref:hypothetical protein n=1 Tax=Rothia nasimurium TaxID=85336 RepID=UPI001F45AFD2|nr:hypothetical protein [Rothia nasimurium]